MKRKLEWVLATHPQGAGLIRLARALGVVGILVVWLLVARTWAPDLGAALAGKVLLKHLSDHIVWDNQTFLDQFLTYLVTLAGGWFLVTVWFLFDQAVLKRSLVGCGVRVAVFVAALVASFSVSKNLGTFILAGALVATPVLASYAGGGRSRSQAPREKYLAAWVLVVALIVTAWASWLVVATEGWGPFAAIAPIFVAVFAGTRLVRVREQMPRDVVTLRRDAIACAPLLLLPLLGLVRAPSPWWLILAVFATIAIQQILRRTNLTRPFPIHLATVFAPLSLGAIFIIPLNFRDVGTINNMNHEAQHLGWVSGAFFGKFFGVDSSFTYGPLREYLIALWLRVTSITAEQIRVAHVLLSLIGFGILLHAGWVVSRRKPVMQLWLAYMLLVHSPLSCFIRYRLYISFGYADLLRTALPLSAVIYLVRAVGDLPNERPNTRDLRPVFFAAVISGGSLFYSQEFGICGVATSVLALLGDAFLHRSLGVRKLWARSFMISRAYLVGVLVVPILFTLIYALFGKAGPLWVQLFRMTTLAASGTFGSARLPITSETLLTPWVLTRDWIYGAPQDHRFHDPLIAYLVPPAVYLLAGTSLLITWIRRRLSARSLLLFALLVFGVASYRMTLARADVYHLMTATAPALLLLTAVSADALDYRIGTLHSWFYIPLGTLAVVCFIIFSIFTGEEVGGLSLRVKEIARGIETPPNDKPYVHAAKRIGDIAVEARWDEVVAEIQKRTTRQQPIFVTTGMMDGPEIYFLADRRNATRYDMLPEIVTTSDQDELLEELKRDPPALVIGNDEKFIGPKVAAYLHQNFTVHSVVGGISFAARP